MKNLQNTSKIYLNVNLHIKEPYKRDNILQKRPIIQSIFNEKPSMKNQHSTKETYYSIHIQ